ncbi:MAG: hypothetical protein ACOYOL_09605 [Chthoniobacterales bacterium]
MKTNPFYESLAVAGLAMVALYSTPARAGVIVQPVSITPSTTFWQTSASSGGTFDGAFTMNGTGLSNASLVANGQPDIGNAGTTLSSMPTHSDAYGTAGRYDLNGSSTFPPFLTFDLGAGYDATGVYLWNYTENFFGSYFNNRGINSATFDFYSSGFAYLGSQTVSFTQAPDAAENLPQYASFATTYTNARFVNLKINSNFEGALTTNSIIGFDEIRFTAQQTPYQAWVQSYGLTGANTNTTADPDLDGFNNTLEFGFGTPPNAPNASLLTTATSGANLVVTYLARTATNEATYTFQSSTNLTASWLTPDLSIVPTNGPTSPTPPTNYTRQQFTVPTSGNEFFRIQTSVVNP